MTAQNVEIKNNFFNLLFSNGDFRKLKVNDVEFIQRIYFAVRDEEWLNEPYTITNFRSKTNQNVIIYSYTMSFGNDIKLVVDITFAINNNHITIEAKGKALKDFKKNRIGFCMHLPVSLRSADCNITHDDDKKSEAVFPRFVSPHQPFKNIRSIEWNSNNLGIKISFEGDIFEMEDQRNWTDASYKIYSTPLDKPFPVLVNKEEEFYQKISVEILESKSIATIPAHIHLSKNIEETVASPMFGIVEDRNNNIDGIISENKKTLSFSHYRVDFFLSNKSWQKDSLQRVVRAAALNLPVYAVVVFGNNYQLQATEFIAYIQSLKNFAVHSVCLLSSQNFVLPDEAFRVLIPLMRNAFSTALLGGGTDANFAQLNRHRPNASLLDFVCYSIQPQEHASDELSVIENIQGQADTVATAKSFSKEKDIHIAALSFFRRFNANIDFVSNDKTVACEHTGSSLEASWFIGSLHELITAGAACINCYYPLRENLSLIKILIFMAQNPPESFYTCGSYLPEKYSLLSWKSGSYRHSFFANLTNALVKTAHPFGAINLQPYEISHIKTLL